MSRSTRIESQRAHAGQRGVKYSFLLDGLFGGEHFRGRNVRECAGQTQVRTIRQRARERRNLRRRNSQPVHPGINLEMKVEWAFARLWLLCGCFFQKQKLIGAHNRRRQMIVENSFFLAPPEAGENEHQFADAALAQFSAFREAKSRQTGRRALYERARATGTIPCP